MPEIKGNIITEKFSGALGKQLVFRVMNGKTFVSKYPDRSKVKYNEEQVHYREVFAKAARYASEIVKDPVKKAAYPVKDGNSVYYAALKDYMAEYRKKNPKENPHSVSGE